jgi:5-methylcytosine-specific restriction endonuclease McrA
MKKENLSMTLLEIQDEQLLIDCKAQVLIEKKATSKVLEYLNEIDKRRLWVKEGYGSLFDFCIRYLGYSEGEANRRIQAARLTQRVESVKPLLEKGEVSLTSLTLLSPILTQENAKTILPQVIGKPIREVEKVIHQHFPERAIKKETFEVELDEELKSLLERAKQIASEKNSNLLLKKVLKAYVREKRPRRNSGRSIGKKFGGKSRKKEGHSSVRQTNPHPRKIPASTAAKVKASAGYQCEYRSPKGIRCSQTAHLEIDHIRPYALGGSSKDLSNLRALCKVHNLYFAKIYFKKSREFSRKRA